MTAPVFTEQVVMTPGTVGGKPRIAGTRIRVHDVVIWHLERGRSISEIVSEIFPAITEAEAYAALSFYYDNRELIEEIMEREEHFEEEFRAEFPHLVAPPLHE